MAKETHTKILTICKAITSADGLAAIEIRRVASECGIAVGTVYRYFPSKTALLMATVESIWGDIGEDVLSCTQQQNSFIAAVECLYTIIKKSSERYPGFYTGHSQVILPKQRTEGRQAMAVCFQLMKADLSQSLKNDKTIDPSIFNAAFAPDDLVDFTFNHILSALTTGSDCRFLCELLRRSLH